jgi:pimeloyl-ACP methyl ester carboxylesterase
MAAKSLQTTRIASLLLGVTLASAAPAAAQVGHYASVNGLKLYYEIHGDGFPLVLLHGAFGFVEGWTNILPTLAKTHRVLAIELEGHGHTRDLDRPLSYAQMSDDVAQLLKQLEIHSADFFGYSMGGTVALGVAIRHPALVRKLATFGSSALGTGSTNETATTKRRFRLPAGFAPPELKLPYDRTAPDPARWPILVAKITELINDFNGYPDGDLKAIKAPVLIMIGDRDEVRPERAVALYRLIPKSQLAVLPGSDHFLLWSNPQKALTLLTPFLADAAPAKPPH